MLTVVVLVGAACFSSSTAFDYCSISPENSLCLYSRPLPLTLTAASKAFILSLYNTNRRRVAHGEINIIQHGGIQLPSASNMRELSWDDELATMAQAWANQCVMNYDANRDVQRFSVGQTLDMYFKGDASPTLDFLDELSSDYWIATGRFVELPLLDSFTSDPSSAHFTQLIWANSYKVGFAVSCYELDYEYDGTVFTNMYSLLVCNYGPAGNVAGQPVYLKGDPASACPNGTTPNDGLCA